MINAFINAFKVFHRVVLSCTAVEETRTPVNIRVIIEKYKWPILPWGSLPPPDT